MDKICLIRPSSKGLNYQNLSDLSAIEPPHWMLCRAAQLRSRGNSVKIWDMETTPFSEDTLNCDKYEIWPTGVHPSAFIQEKSGIAEALKNLNGNPSDIFDYLPPGTAQHFPAYDLIDPKDYRAHNWQVWGSKKGRERYGTAHTSQSCPFKCNFCTIRSYYRDKYYESTLPVIIYAMERLKKAGVQHIKMMDELFIKKSKTFRNLMRSGALKDYGFNIWGYARIDTIDYSLLPKIKEAGVNWVCLGIESGNQAIRESVHKGKFTNQDIKDCVQALKDNGISVLGNYMFGFHEDTFDTMKETYDLAVQLQCEYSNFYCMVGYPGTEAEMYARKHKWALPSEPSGFAQYSRDFLPLKTNTLGADEVLAFKDKHWYTYHTGHVYLSMMDKKFGEVVAGEIIDMTERRIERTLLAGTFEDYYGKQ